MKRRSLGWERFEAPPLPERRSPSAPDNKAYQSSPPARPARRLGNPVKRRSLGWESQRLRLFPSPSPGFKPILPIKRLNFLTSHHENKAIGWVQREGGPIEEIHPGDVVWFEPNEKHWHGASPNKAMSHMAIQEELDGAVVTWMEKVSDAQYAK